MVKYIKELKKPEGFSIMVTGAITCDGLLAEIENMAEAGVIAISDDGNWTENSFIFYQALKYAKRHDLLVIDHAQDTVLFKSGRIYEGQVSFQTGLKGFPKAAEAHAVYRDGTLNLTVGAKLHITHLSTVMGLDTISFLKHLGSHITADVTPHHLLFDDTAYLEYGKTVGRCGGGSTNGGGRLFDMDKRVNKMVPLIFDLKTVSYVGYFILLAFAAVMIFFLVLMGGAATKYILLQTTVFVVSVVGVLAWILTPYMEIVQPESKELILSLPIDGFKYGFLRMLRLFAIYTGFVLLLLYFIYSISDGDRLEYGIVDIFLIAGALFFVSGFGMTAFLVSRQLIIGYGIPILWVAISFFTEEGPVGFGIHANGLIRSLLSPR